MIDVKHHKIGLLCFLALLLIAGLAYGQNAPYYQQMQASIDSVAASQNIKQVKIKILEVTNTFDQTDTDKKTLAKAADFHFEGPFLVVDEKYFNLTKLLYFYRKGDRLEFFFQGY